MRLYLRRKKNGTKVWWGSWTANGVTVRRSTRHADREAAELVSRRWERERADPELEAARQATLEAECVTFLRECRAADLAAGTVDMYERKLSNVCEVLGRSTPLAEIGPQAVDRYFTLRDDEGASDSTQYKEWIALAGVLKSAKHRERFPRDVGSLKPPRLSPRYVPRETWLSAAQANKLLAELKGDHRRIVAYVLATGMRRAEWRRASAIDVDPSRFLVVVRGTKTEKSAAVIPVPRPMRRWLRIAGKPPFPTWTNCYRGITAACERAGIPRVTWNDLRRTFCTLLAQAGVPEEYTRQLMRHSNSQMVRRVYARQTPATLGALVERSLHSARRPPVNQRKRKTGKKGKPRGH